MGSWYTRSVVSDRVLLGPGEISIALAYYNKKSELPTSPRIDLWSTYTTPLTQFETTSTRRDLVSRLSIQPNQRWEKDYTMGSSDTKARVAYMVDADDDGNPISGTRRSAKESRHKSSKSSKDERRISRSDTGPMMSGALMTEQDPAKLERRRSTTSRESPTKSRDRPPSSHGNKTLPKVSSIKTDLPSYYGVTASTPTRKNPVVTQPPPYPYPVAQPVPIRPRTQTAQTFAGRPTSYHAAYTGGGYGPPPSASAYYQPPLQMAAPSYPPPSPSSFWMQRPGAEYFDPQPVVNRPLSQRFGVSEPILRTSSAYGTRDFPVQRQVQDAYEDGYASASEGPRRSKSIREPSGRRTSMSRKPEVAYDHDREAMPPPPRPAGILRNRTTEYHPDTSSVPDPPEYRLYSTARRVPSPHRTSHRNSVSYDFGPETEPVRVETANTSHRRQSYYGQSAASAPPVGSGGLEAKIREAESYQADVGGPTIPLTAEALRRRHAGSSRSTKSSGSRDESDYRKSATTRTTRSGSGEEGDFTIKVKGGQARVMVGGARIDCTEGGEIEIKQQKSLRNGSERSNSVYGGDPRIDDRRSRLERPSGRSRKSSVSGHSGGSYTRSTPQYPMGQFI